MDYSQYGLTSTNASKADHDKGIVKAPDGSFYQIEGFKRNQKEGLDNDGGKAFSGSLESDAAKGGYSPTTFNTATDVENALRHLEAPSEESTPQQFGDSFNEYTFSPQVQGAIERAASYRDRAWSGQQSQDIFGPKKTLANGVPADAGSAGTDKAGEAADLATSETYFDAEKYKQDYGEEYKASSKM